VKQYRPVHTAVRLALAAGLAASLTTPAAALAQPESPANLGKVSVTGTRIKRTDIVTSQPVTTISHQQIENSGLKSIGQILDQIPSVGYAEGVADGAHAGSGAERINLRYLGDNRLLVLLNGKRVVASFGGSVDLTEIPVAAVDHIEILQDGASAIYGSDAIAGVVNIITKTNFNGAEATAHYGIANGDGHWDGQSQQYAVTLGLSNNRGHFIFTGQYRAANAIPSYDRKFALPDPILGHSRGSTTTPQGRFLFIAPSGGDPARPGNPPAAFTGLTPQQCPDNNFGTEASPLYLPNCNLTIIKGTSGRSPADYKAFTPQDRYLDFIRNTPITVNQDIKSIYSEGSYNITPSVAIDASVLYTRRQSVTPDSSDLVFFTRPDATVLADNPYNPFGFTLSKKIPVEVAPGVKMPTLTGIYRRTSELGRRIESYDSRTLRFEGGFSGDFNLGSTAWDWNADYIYATNDVNRFTDNQSNDVTISLATSPQCGEIEGCVPLNLFGGEGSITPAQANYINTRHHIRSLAEKDFRAIEGTISSSDIFDLPGGPLGIAAGYQHRNVSGKSRPGAIAQIPNKRNPEPAQILQGSYNVDSLFGELNVPVLSHLPGVNYLGIDAATRWSNYSTFGSTVNSRVGVKYQPIEDVVLRGTYAEGFRAANVKEAFNPKTISYPVITDPCDNYSATNKPAGVQKNCQA
jgi:iron complex outermembrane receptor protein